MTEELTAEAFWAGEFGNAYSARNESEEILRANQRFFELSLLPARYIRASRVIEFGANVGMNLRALQLIPAFACATFTAVEINRLACARLREHGIETHHADFTEDQRSWGDGYDIVICKGVCIHVPEKRLRAAFAALYDASNRFVFLAEYFAAQRREVTYRGNQDKLWLDDYGSRFWDQYPDLECVDTGFAWKRDKLAPQDNLVWHIFEKRLP